MSVFYFGSGTNGSTNTGSGYSEPGMTTTSTPVTSSSGFSIGTVLDTATATPASTTSTTHCPGLGGILSGQTPAGGFSFNTPASSSPATSAPSTGFSWAFNKPTASVKPLSLTTTATTSTTAPAGAGLTFGSVLTSTAPQQPAATGLTLGLGGTTTTTSALTGPSLGGGLFSNTVSTGSSQATLGTGGACPTAASAASAPSTDLGGIDFWSTFDFEIDTSGTNVKEFLKEQKKAQEEINTLFSSSSKALLEIKDDIKTIKQNLSARASGIQHQTRPLTSLYWKQHRWSGRAFHRLGAAEQKARSPMLCNLVLGTLRRLAVLERRDPSSAVLYVLELVNALARDPDEERITIIQPGGDKGVYQFFSIGQRECGAELGNVPKVVDGGLTQMLDVGVKCQMGVHSHAQTLKQKYLSFRQAILGDSSDVFDCKRAPNRK
ncbi:nucleoporin p58/p45-like [Antennarius striatus]|uniref:nucleoporin p58/p45-like n=1 Tax=Antennarius striatus TaxID=241820 RepID=UPI0035B350D8